MLLKVQQQKDGQLYFRLVEKNKISYIINIKINYNIKLMDYITIFGSCRQQPIEEYFSVSSIQDNLNYPPSAIELGIQGKVTLKFVVEKNGQVSNVSVVRGIPGCAECDKEAIKVVSKMPNWKSAKNAGKQLSDMTLQEMDVYWNEAKKK
jgi:TonB family protein